MYVCSNKTSKCPLPALIFTLGQSRLKDMANLTTSIVNHLMYCIVSIPAEQVMITLWQSTLPSSTGEGGLSEQEAAATQDTTAEVSIQIDIVDIV